MYARPNRRLLLWLVAAAFLLPVTVTMTPSAEAATTRVLEITTASAGPAEPFAAFDGNPPKVYDLNGDGQLEIIAQNDNQYAYVFDSKNGKLLAEVKTKFPAGWGARSFNGPEVSLMNEDGKVKVILANSAAFITSYRFDPLTSTSSKFALVKEWDVRLNQCHTNPGMDAKPVLADLDKDGRLDILAATEESGIYALRADGTMLWKRCIGGGNAEPGVDDINRDGILDVVHVSDGGMVTVLDGASGATIWNRHIPSHFNVGAGSMPVGPAVAQLNGKGGPDIVVGVRDSHDHNDWSNNHALLVALGADGHIMWGKKDTEKGNPLTYTHPIIVDAAGDGTPEVYWGDWNTNGHKPPFDESEAWQVTGPANFYRYDPAGNVVWRQSLGTWWSNKDLAIADVDGDGVQEVLANGPNSQGHDGIWYLNTNTGAKEGFVDVFPFKVMRGPIVADLWGTNTMQFVVPVGKAAAGGANGILVYNTGQKFNAAWPHLPYPEVGSPAPPPPAGDSFGATFTIKAPNAWWQEVYVDPDEPRTISKVQVRIDGGAWRSMEKSSWGAWTSSYNTPKGTQVEFLATAGNGDTSQSEPFTWLDGTTTRRSTDGGGAIPPPPPFDPDFQVPDTVNEWWVEVDVTADQPVTAVDARVNGGTWRGLDETDWGTWAKSFNVAKGSTVEFRATSSTGDQAISEKFTWLSSGDAAFEASFDPRAVGNDWWIEVGVSANKPVAKVETSLDNGAWTTLDKTDWGTWAKSIHAPDGTQVKFRATDGNGDTDTSTTYTWS